MHHYGAAYAPCYAPVVFIPLLYTRNTTCNVLYLYHITNNPTLVKVIGL